ncbi:hypothetical protein TYRP_023662 [Tyrophagus putrescentiae]|nr:hypothetical protein TYRP_023661 [Tyrophagus putrescentiae]KAH9409826.1 hypothetical protein TYRP_023662 [Tyrophagus putrescentiae]
MGPGSDTATVRYRTDAPSEQRKPRAVRQDQLWGLGSGAGVEEQAWSRRGAGKEEQASRSGGRGGGSSTSGKEHQLMKLNMSSSVLRDDQQWKGRRPYDNGARYRSSAPESGKRRRPAGLQSVSYGAREDHRLPVEAAAAAVANAEAKEGQQEC